MGFYSFPDKLHITFHQTTIIRRLNVHGIKIRTMLVVIICLFYYFIGKFLFCEQVFLLFFYIFHFQNNLLTEHFNSYSKSTYRVHPRLGNR